MLASLCYERVYLSALSVLEKEAGLKGLTDPEL